MQYMGLSFVIVANNCIGHHCNSKTKAAIFQTIRSGYVN